MTEVSFPVRGDEEHRSEADIVHLPNQLRHFKAVHIGHLHIEQNAGVRALEQFLQRFLAGVGAVQRVRRILENALERGEVLDPIIDRRIFTASGRYPVCDRP